MKKTNTYGEFKRQQYRNNLQRYFGDSLKFVSDRDSKHIQYDPVQSEDIFVIRTSHVRIHNGRLILIVGAKKAVYLQPFQIKQAKDEQTNLSFFLVRVKRQFFKTYEFRQPFEGFLNSPDYDFDSLREVARSQTGTVVLK